MESAKPNVFIINIHPENWDACVQDHIFGLRKGTRHPKFTKGDVFLVRRTGADYGVTGIWLFSTEEDITESHKIPWFDAEYTILLTYSPLVDFQSPMSEEFAGRSKYSSKVETSAVRLAGSAPILYGPEIVKYLKVIIREKAEELRGTFDYRGKATSVIDFLNELISFHSEEKEPLPPTTIREQRDYPVGEPINFRGMIYAPLNEAGVVLLFSKVMDDLGIIYESSPPNNTGFDMVGREQTDKGYVRRHIEFEYWSSNFKAHGHDPNLVDYIVCWGHDWVGCPDDLKVIELREVIKGLEA